MVRRKILIIDDDKEFFQILSPALALYNIEHANTLKSAGILLHSHKYDLVILDLNLNPENPDKLEGLNYIETIKGRYPILPIIVMSSRDDVDTITTAMRLGASDYFWKQDYLLEILRSRIKLVIDAKLRLEERFPFVGQSREITELKEQLKSLSRTDKHLLLQGGVGAGKTTAAHYYHSIGKRSFQDFYRLEFSVYTDEAELDEEFLKLKKGIVFIKEIDRLSVRAQDYLIKVIHNQKIGGSKTNVQIIATTRRDMRAMISEHQFQSELYYAFEPIDIPALHHRKEDIICIADYYMREAVNKGFEQLVDPKAKRALLSYAYPNNISELKYIVKKALSQKQFNNSPRIDLNCLPREVVYQNDERGGFELKEFKKAAAYTTLEYIERALIETHGQKGKSAKLLGLNSDDLRYLIQKYQKEYPGLFEFFPSIVNAYKVLFEPK